MGPKPIVKKRSAEEIRKITQEARDRAYERGIENAHSLIETTAGQGEWFCQVSAADFYEHAQDFINYFMNLGYTVSFNEEYCSIFIGWREKF